MSFQAYLDKAEEITGQTPRQFIELAQEKNLTEFQAIMTWLKNDYGLGTGHARAIAHVILHPQDVATLHLEGKKARQP